MARIFSDSKTFVDMKTIGTEEETIENFEKWNSQYPDPTPENVKEFVSANFGDVGSEFEPWIPVDHKNFTDLQISHKIADPKYREWAAYLHNLWLDLGKKIKKEVKDNPQHYSIIPIEHPFIVPGGRFREIYYWDSYWVVQGLLWSEMYSTVRGMIQNLLYMAKLVGFVPNGGRVYYWGRSQPPLLTPMVRAYCDATGDYAFLNEALSILEMEFKYWKKEHAVWVKGYRLYRYFENTCDPRPESYFEDILTASSCNSEEDRQNMYSEIKAAANSGMDFSSRWYIVNNGTNQGELKDMKTRSVVAVDLNAWMYYIAKSLAYLFLKSKSGNSSVNRIRSVQYENEASLIKKAINQVLWNEKAGCWLDYDLINRKSRDYFVASNLVPLYVECYDEAKRSYISKRILQYIKANNLDDFVSLPNTLFESENGQQWDYPNVWPPMQHIAVMGLDKLGTTEATEMAYRWCARYVRSNHAGFTKNNHCYMYEKYNCLKSGYYGGGGEYDIQTGFGWSNGVILSFLNKYGGKLSSTDEQLLTCSPLSQH
ncbi:hypothetical protein HA402_003401 [Bradysia odoriphaga]|nr:hypothetical protein HA402_003401 [Bradysia odoriphaga]